MSATDCFATVSGRPATMVVTAQQMDGPPRIAAPLMLLLVASSWLGGCAADGWSQPLPPLLPPPPLSLLTTGAISATSYTPPSPASPPPSLPYRANVSVDVTVSPPGTLTTLLDVLSFVDSGQFMDEFDDVTTTYFSSPEDVTFTWYYPPELPDTIRVIATTQSASSTAIIEQNFTDLTVGTFNSLLNDALKRTSVVGTGAGDIRATSISQPPVVTVHYAPPSLPPPPQPPPSPVWGITISGGCNIALGKLAALNYIVQGRTASGAPYYKAAGWEYWLYWDPDCSGGSRGEAARWIVNYVAPNTTAVRNLDGSSLCIHKGGIDSVDYKHNTTQLNARGKEGCVLSPFKCNFRLLRGLARKGVGMLRFRFVTGAQAPVHVLVPRWRARGE